MALNAWVDSFCHSQKKCGNERVKHVFISRHFLTTIGTGSDPGDGEELGDEDVQYWC